MAPCKTECFEGPLDLLLHLIDDKNKIDIYDIPISEITDQYIWNISTLWKKEDLSMESLWSWQPHF